MKIVPAILTVYMLSTTQAQTCTSPTPLCDCYVQDATFKKIISCRYKNLTQVPLFSASSDTYDRIEFTSVQETGTCFPSQRCNNITQLGTDAFQNLRVKEIDLRNNPINNIDVNAFRGLESILESLLIEGDGVIFPPYSSISSLQILQSLHLKHFQQTEFNSGNTQLSFPLLNSLTIENFETLTRLDAGAFQNVRSIETFRLQNLPTVVTLPVLTILSFDNLTTLDIYETGITQILGESFKGLNYLKTVEIKSNRYLNLITNNAFDGVSSTIEFLSLFQNNIGSFAFLAQASWPKLTQLNIGYNFAQILSGTFSTMPMLNYLTMADMSVQGITSDMFTGLAQLHTLDLGYNRISNIPADVFRNSPHLIDLRLNNQNENNVNTQLSFDNTAFVSIENSLQHLIIGNNRLIANQFWSKVEKFVNLIELKVPDTGLTSIPNNVFRNNIQLQTIDLSSNSISTVVQETFFGPRDTLSEINLSRNQIKTATECVFWDFPTQPEIFLTGNPLQCDCQLIWLYSWYQDDNNRADSHIGACSSPPSLSGKTFKDFPVTDLVCSPDFQEADCRDLYTTTTTSTTTTTTSVTTTPTTTTTTARPIPEYTVSIIHREATEMTVAWSVSDRTFVTEYKLEIIKDGRKFIQVINKEKTEQIVDGLDPETFYNFCLFLQIEGVYPQTQPECDSGNTLAEVTEPPSTTPTPESQVNIPVIVGSAVGGIILVVLIILIIFFIMKSKKPMKRPPMTQPVSFEWRADMPQAGGTAKRHAKKPDKEGASPDDITVNVISSGNMNSERMSAGSYQFLNDPRAVNSKPMPTMSNGHYVNNIETRPLPRMPNGARGNHGYVNDAFHSGATNYPETSTNAYTEV